MHLTELLEKSTFFDIHINGGVCSRKIFEWQFAKEQRRKKLFVKKPLHSSVWFTNLLKERIEEEEQKVL